MNEVSFNIKKIEELEYGANYQVTVEFPLIQDGLFRFSSGKNA